MIWGETVWSTKQKMLATCNSQKKKKPNFRKPIGKKNHKQFQNTHKIYLSSSGMDLLPHTTRERADISQWRNKAAFVLSEMYLNEMEQLVNSKWWAEVTWEIPESEF